MIADTATNPGDVSSGVRAAASRWVGQVALTKKPTWFDKPPPDYVRISPGRLCGEPVNLQSCCL